MASGITDYGSGEWLKTMLGLRRAPAAYYLALCLSEPGVAMDGDLLSDLEPGDASYRRQRINAGTGAWIAADAGYVTTKVDVDFANAVSDWGLVTHYALCTAATSGDVYAWGELLNSVYVSAGFGVVLPAGGVVLALTALDAPIAV